MNDTAAAVQNITSFILQYVYQIVNEGMLMIGRRMNKSPDSLDSPHFPLSRCLAKSRKTAENTVLPGRLVLSHCQIVGEVARAMMLRMPDWLRTALFPDGAELIAAAHDIGKVSPTFPVLCSKRTRLF